MIFKLFYIKKKNLLNTNCLVLDIHFYFFFMFKIKKIFIKKKKKKYRSDFVDIFKFILIHSTYIFVKILAKSVEPIFFFHTKIFFDIIFFLLVKKFFCKLKIS